MRPFSVSPPPPLSLTPPFSDKQGDKKVTSENQNEAVSKN